MATAAGRAQRYTTRRGDTLVTVADRFGVGVEDLRAWNHLSSNKLTPGRSLYVAEPVRLAPTATDESRVHRTDTRHRRMDIRRVRIRRMRRRRLHIRRRSTTHKQGSTGR